MGMHRRTPDDTPIGPRSSNGGTPPLPTHCKHCLGQMRTHRGAVVYCQHCDKTDQMVGIMPDREYYPETWVNPYD